MIDDVKEYRIKKLELIKSIASWMLLAAVTIFGITRCSPQASYELKEAAGNCFLVNKETGSVAHVLLNKVVQLSNETLTLEKPPLKLSELPFSYNSKDSFEASLHAKWSNGLFHYKISFCPSPAISATKSQAFLKAIADGSSDSGAPPAIDTSSAASVAAYNQWVDAQRIRIILRDKDDFEVFSVSLPKLRSVDISLAAIGSKNVTQTKEKDKNISIPISYEGESSTPMDIELCNQIQSWGIDWGGR